MVLLEVKEVLQLIKALPHQKKTKNQKKDKKMRFDRIWHLSVNLQEKTVIMKKDVIYIYWRYPLWKRKLKLLILQHKTNTHVVIQHLLRALSRRNGPPETNILESIFAFFGIQRFP